jgi:Sec-independent protein translocase protein TatA
MSDKDIFALIIVIYAALLLVGIWRIPKAIAKSIDDLGSGIDAVKTALDELGYKLDMIESNTNTEWKERKRRHEQG